MVFLFFFFKQKTAYEMRISDWSSDVCSSDLVVDQILEQRGHYLASIEPERLPVAMANTSALDLEGVMAFGLFSADGRHLAGNLAELPPDIAADGRVRLLAHGLRRIDRLAVQRARALSVRLASV